jgi:hypothetical protein
LFGTSSGEKVTIEKVSSREGVGLIHQYSSSSAMMMNPYSCGVVTMLRGDEEIGLEQRRAAAMVNVKIGMFARAQTARAQTGASAYQKCECHDRPPGESVVAQMSTMRHSHLS